MRGSYATGRRLLFSLADNLYGISFIPWWVFSIGPHEVERDVKFSGGYSYWSSDESRTAESLSQASLGLRVPLYCFDLDTSFALESIQR